MIKPPPFVRVFPPFVRIFPPFWTSSRWPPGDGSDNPPRSVSLTPPDNDNGDAFSRRQTACYRVRVYDGGVSLSLGASSCFLLFVACFGFERKKKRRGGDSKGSGCVSAFVWLLSLIFLKKIILFYFFIFILLFILSLFFRKIKAP